MRTASRREQAAGLCQRKLGGPVGVPLIQTVVRLQLAHPVGDAAGRLVQVPLCPGSSGQRLSEGRRQTARGASDEIVHSSESGVQKRSRNAVGNVPLLGLRGVPTHPAECPAQESLGAFRTKPDGTSRRSAVQKNLSKLCCLSPDTVESRSLASGRMLACLWR